MAGIRLPAGDQSCWSRCSDHGRRERVDHDRQSCLRGDSCAKAAAGGPTTRPSSPTASPACERPAHPAARCCRAGCAGEGCTEASCTVLLDCSTAKIPAVDLALRNGASNGRAMIRMIGRAQLFNHRGHNRSPRHPIRANKRRYGRRALAAHQPDQETTPMRERDRPPSRSCSCADPARTCGGLLHGVRGTTPRDTPFQHQHQREGRRKIGHRVAAFPCRLPAAPRAPIRQQRAAGPPPCLHDWWGPASGRPRPWPRAAPWTRRLRGGAGPGAAPFSVPTPRRAIEEAEKLAVRRQHEAGGVVPERSRVGLQRAVEGEEVDVLAERLGKDLDRLRVTLAADDLALPLGLGGSPVARGRPGRGSAAPARRPAPAIPWPRARARSASGGRSPDCSRPAGPPA